GVLPAGFVRRLRDLPARAVPDPAAGDGHVVLLQRRPVHRGQRAAGAGFLDQPGVRLREGGGARPAVPLRRAGEVLDLRAGAGGAAVPAGDQGEAVAGVIGGYGSCPLARRDPTVARRVVQYSSEAAANSA